MSTETKPNPIVRVSGVRLSYGKKQALDGITIDIPTGKMVGLIGPDGVGKSSLLALISGARTIQEGTVEVLGGDMSGVRHRGLVCPRIAYMPQGLGKNLYATLSVEENLQFFARLFGHGAAERRRRIDDLTRSTGLYPFLKRPAGKLSGGMKQKLSLCCSLIHDPELLILDEPTTGVDPLSRRQFWDLIARLRTDGAGLASMSVMVATAYMEDAEGFEWLVAMDDGRVLATGTPSELRESTHSRTLEEAFIALLPEEKRREHQPVKITPFIGTGPDEIAIESRGLTMRFGAFTAVDHVTMRIPRGEIFGFLGSNGCGKTTTMEMLTGLLPPTEGEAVLFGRAVDAQNMETRRRVGYMSQAFSLYKELTVRQNLVLHARLFRVPSAEMPARVAEMAQRFGLLQVMDALPESLPLGVRQRLSLAVAMVHKPDLLILDEPTSGVDPVARDSFWRLMIELSRRDRVTIFISTHFMNEGERCDRISLMHAGKVLACDSPAAIVRDRGANGLEEAFIAHLVDAGAESSASPQAAALTEPRPVKQPAQSRPGSRAFSVGRALSYSRRETLEVRRDPMRAALALVGSMLLLIALGYGITLDVENLNYAVLDRDDTGLSRNYALNLSGSRYFSERPPIAGYEELDRRMKSGELSLVIELPPGFGRDMERGDPVQVGAWVDGAMPQRAETVRGYAQGMHLHWLTTQAERRGADIVPDARVESRYRYNLDIKSVRAIVPAVIPMLLLMFPAMLAALAVVREKELGSITNFYVTPVTRIEFILGKQFPYIALGMINCVLMIAVTVVGFGVPMRGSLGSLLLASLLYVTFATSFGLLVSSFVRSQTAAIFGTMLLTFIPVINYSGLVYPVSSLEGTASVIGAMYPASHMITISRGVFSKALGLADLPGSFAALALAVPVTMLATIILLRKQER